MIYLIEDIPCNKDMALNWVQYWRLQGKDVTLEDYQYRKTKF